MGLFVYFRVAVNLGYQKAGKRVNNRNPNSVQSSGNFISTSFTKFSPAARLNRFQADFPVFEWYQQGCRPSSSTKHFRLHEDKHQYFAKKPAMASSMALSTTSHTRWCRPAISVVPIYMPGRLLNSRKTPRPVCFRRYMNYSRHLLILHFIHNSITKKTHITALYHRQESANQTLLLCYPFLSKENITIHMNQKICSLISPPGT